MDQFQLIVAVLCGLVTLIAVIVRNVWKNRASEKPRELEEPSDTKYVLNFVNILSLCYVSLFIFSA